MELQHLVNSLNEIISLCVQLEALLKAKRSAMTALRLDEMQGLLMEEELLLERVRSQDQEFKEQIRVAAGRLGLTPERFMERPEARGLRPLRDTVKSVQQRIREEGDKTRLLAEHVSGFLKQMQGEAQAPLTYSPRTRTYPSHLQQRLH